MHISLIVAASTNNAIGKKGELLWKLPNDTKFFKNATWALPVIMGRKTFESLGKPLQGRSNIVITGQKDFAAKGATIVDNLAHAIDEAALLNTNEIMVIGGGQIYKEAIEKVATKIYITRVHTNFDDADAFFPTIDETQWQRVFQKDFFKDEKHAFDYTFETWERKQLQITR